MSVVAVVAVVTVVTVVTVVKEVRRASARDGRTPAALGRASDGARRDT